MLPSYGALRTECVLFVDFVFERSPNMKKRRRRTELLGLSRLNDFSKRNKMHVSCMCMCHVAKAHEGPPHIKIAICNYEGNTRDLLK
jgi:hypothetical protein